jgi:proteasome assembly chaperone (PAC2) family protein
MGCREIITLGGIGLPSEVKSPNIFGAVTDAGMLTKYKKYRGIKFSTSQKIEAIVGASGLLLGLARLRGIRGVSLLTETYANQFHVGFKEAKIVLCELKKILDLKIDLAPLEKEIETAAHEKLKLNKPNSNPETKLMRRVKTPITNEPKPDVGYFG